MANYSFPIDSDWTTDEIVMVVEFLNLVEKTYLDGVPLGELLDKYKKFKTVVDSISGEKSLGREFKAASGYEIYPVVKSMRELEKSNADLKTIVKL